MTLASRYVQMYKSLPEKKIDLNYGGVELFAPSEIEQKQLGYAVDPQGNSLCHGKDGDWRPEWVVVGCDTGTGDPIILDLSSDQLPILTDIHGQGAWNPEVVATSVEAFGRCFAELAEFSAKYLAAPRDNDAEDIVDEDDHAAYEARIAAYNGTPEAPEFWSGFLGYL